VQDNHLVPKCTACVDSRYIWDQQIEIGKIVTDIWLRDKRLVRVKCGFRAGFDLDSPPDIFVSRGRDRWIP
jgi:hypothetical protein